MSLFFPAAGSGKAELKQQYVQTETLDITTHEVQAKRIEHQQSTGMSLLEYKVMLLKEAAMEFTHR